MHKYAYQDTQNYFQYSLTA